MPYTEDGGWEPAEGEHFIALTADQVLEAQCTAFEKANGRTHISGKVYNSLHPVMRDVFKIEGENIG
jgi:hypothetical protein